MTLARPMFPPVNPTRRRFLSQAAAASAGGAVLTVAALSPAVAGPVPSATAGPATGRPDPIFAAIERHKAAKAAFYDCVTAHSRLEEALPKNQRQSHIDAHGENIVATDDPRWIDAERAVDVLGNAEIDAACALVSVAPTTIAGVIALLQYATAADTDGHCWPADLLDDAETKTRSWQYFLIEMLAEVLLDMAVQS